jgi:hypothetical protein
MPNTTLTSNALAMMTERVGHAYQGALMADKSGCPVRRRETASILEALRGRRLAIELRLIRLQSIAPTSTAKCSSPTCSHTSLEACLDADRKHREQGPWTPACGGTETPFTTRTGRRLLYVYQARSGRHAYLDLGTDLILSDEEASAALAH